MSSLDDDQLARLRAAKLRALVTAATGHDPVGVGRDFPRGAALLGEDGAWVLDEDAGQRSLGPALTWALHNDAARLDLVVDADAGVAADLARRATYFSLPVSVWRIEGTTTVAVSPGEATETPSWDVSRAATLVELMASMDLEIIEEDGVVKGELAGLEVARVVPGRPDPVLEVGIGRFDREIASMMHAGEPTARSLVRARDLVARHRFRGAPPHPLRDLMVSRWIRSEILADPSTVGARTLAAISTTVEVANLKDPSPAAAAGRADDGADVVVVCSAGADLDLVPVAADTRAVRRPGARLVLAAPGRNLSPTQRLVADRLIEPARIVEVEAPF